jgi:hypothetical protein
MKNFNKNNYIVIKKAISEELASFCYDYLKLKRNVFNTIFNSNIKDQILFSNMWGTYEDSQIPNTYSHYSDLVMETLLIKLQNLMSKKTKLNLVPTYSYTRIYKKGDELKRHKFPESTIVKPSILERSKYEFHTNIDDTQYRNKNMFLTQQDLNNLKRGE